MPRCLTRNCCGSASDATVTEHVAIVSAVTAGISVVKNACPTIAKMACDCSRWLGRGLCNFTGPSAPTRGAWSRAHLQRNFVMKGPGHGYPRYLGNSFSLSTSWWCLKETAKTFGKQHVGGTSHRTCDLRSRSKQRRDNFEGHVHGGHCIVPPMYPPACAQREGRSSSAGTFLQSCAQSRS